MTTSETIFRVNRLRQCADRSEEQRASLRVFRERVPREKKRHDEQTCSPESDFYADLGHQPRDEYLGDGAKKAAPDTARPDTCKGSTGPKTDCENGQRHVHEDEGGTRDKNQDHCSYGTVGGTELPEQCHRDPRPKGGEDVRKLVVERPVPRNLATQVPDLDRPQQRNPTHSKRVRHLRIEYGSEDGSCRDVGDDVARKTDRERGGNQSDANPEERMDQ